MSQKIDAPKKFSADCFASMFGLQRLGGQLSALVAGGLVAMVVSVSLGTYYFVDRSLKNEFIENGEHIAALLAEQVDLAVLIGTPAGAREDSAVVLSFPGVQQLAIYEGEDKLLAQSGTDHPWVIPDELPTANADNVVLEHDGEDAWQFMSPVFSNDEASELGDIETETHAFKEIGRVRVRISKEQLYDGRRNILIGNVIVLSTGAILLLLALNALSSRLVAPLENFASVMAEGARAERLNLRVELHGSEETETMARSFNTLMQGLEDRENQLAMARDQALEAAKLKSEFAANVSHEIRTPLNGIVGTLNLLGDTELDSGQRDLLDVAGSSSESLIALINNILDFSRLSLDNTALVPVRFDLYQLLDELVFLHAQSSAASAIDIVMNYDAQLPDLVNSDPNKIRQLINNLVSNAVKFTDTGYIAVTASLEAPVDNTIWMKLTVKDTGIGISRDDLRTIFQPYSQSDGSMSRKYSGTGLGLSISEKLTEVLHGDIGVYSEPDRGSEFYVRLPLAGKITPPESEIGQGEPWLGSRILVIARDDHLAESVAAFCQRAGLDVARVRTVDEFRAAVQSGSRGDSAGCFALFYFAAPTGAREIEILVNEYLQGVDLPALVVSRQEPVFDDGQANIFLLRSPLRLSSLIGALNRLSGFDPNTDTRPIKTIASGQSPNILLVEDNPVNQKVASAMLHKLGATVVLAEDGEEALGYCNDTVFDIIFMDCQMPTMSGYEATRRIRSEGVNASVPIVAMTANVDAQDRAHCFEAGMNDFLGKPFRVQELSELLAKWV